MLSVWISSAGLWPGFTCQSATHLSSGLEMSVRSESMTSASVVTPPLLLLIVTVTSLLLSTLTSTSMEPSLSTVLIARSTSGQPSALSTPSGASATVGHWSVASGTKSPSSSGSQASPMPSPSRSSWPGLATDGQLSLALVIVSLSLSLSVAQCRGWFCAWLFRVLGSAIGGAPPLATLTSIWKSYGPPSGHVIW